MFVFEYFKIKNKNKKIERTDIGNGWNIGHWYLSTYSSLHFLVQELKKMQLKKLIQR